MTAFNPGKPNVARIYDALRDGKDNFGPDREAADAIRTMAADGQRAAHDNRAFLARAVRSLIREQGIFQFLGHARAVLEDRLTSIALPGDLRHPQEFLDDPDLRGFIDFGCPVAVMLLAVLHFIEAPLAYEVMRAVMLEMPAGSCLVLSHASADQATPDEIKIVNQIYDQAGTPIYLRTKDEITAFFERLQITVPGVADINAWKNPAYRPARTIGYGGTARKTA
ncbi:MAG: SAM-dependent methyltransferase [Trebonia sp.]